MSLTALITKIGMLVQNAVHQLSQIYVMLRPGPQMVYHDVVHRFHQGVLYLLGVIRFCGTRVQVVPFTPLRQVWPSLSRSSRNSQVLNSFMSKYLLPNITQIGQKMWQTTALPSPMFIKPKIIRYFLTCLASNFIQNGQKVWKVGTEFYLCPWVNRLSWDSW
jgi:hypothetical protein